MDQVSQKIIVHSCHLMSISGNTPFQPQPKMQSKSWSLMPASFSLATFGAPCLQLTSKSWNCFSRWQKLGFKKIQLFQPKLLPSMALPIAITTFDAFKSLRTARVAWTQVPLPSVQRIHATFVSRPHPTSVESRWPPSSDS